MTFCVLVYEHEYASHNILGKYDLCVQRLRSSNFKLILIPDNFPSVITPLLADLQM